MNGGYVKIHRQLEESNVFENPLTFKVFMWCLMRANYTNREIRFHSENITLKPGQFITGRYAGAKACHMKPSTFRNQVNALRFMGTIALKSDNKKTIFTVVNWARFQCEASDEDNKRTTRGHRQEGKKERRKMDGETARRPAHAEAELFPSSEQPGQDKTKPKGKKHDSAVSQFIGYFCEEHMKATGAAYVPKWERDGKAAKTLIHSLGLEEAEARAVRYLERPDEWTREHGFTVSNMLTVVNSLADKCSTEAKPKESGFEASQREARELKRIREQRGNLCQN